jgi:hypothetical protein
MVNSSVSLVFCPGHIAALRQRHGFLQPRVAHPALREALHALGPIEGIGGDEAGVVEPLGVVATEGTQVADLKWGDLGQLR